MAQLKLILLLTLFVSLCISNSAPSLKSITSGQGTLILLTRAKEGLVIVGDKRMLVNNVDVSDTSTKICQLGKFLGFTISGAPFYFDTRTGKSIYNAVSLVKEFFINHKSIANDTLALLSTDLINRFRELLNTHVYKDWPESSNFSDGALYYVVFYFFNKKLHKFQIRVLKFIYKKQLPTPEIFTQTMDFYDSLLSITYPFMIGNNAVYQEIMEGSDKRFDDLRSNADIKKFLIPKGSPRLYSSKEIINFSTFFIQECSKRSYLLAPFLNDISPTVDIAIIDSAKGFKWIRKDTKE